MYRIQLLRRIWKFHIVIEEHRAKTLNGAINIATDIVWARDNKPTREEVKKRLKADGEFGGRNYVVKIEKESPIDE